jgi:hypothetical protein
MTQWMHLDVDAALRHVNIRSTLGQPRSKVILVVWGRLAPNQKWSNFGHCKPCGD